MTVLKIESNPYIAVIHILGQRSAFAIPDFSPDALDGNFPHPVP
jgi:hypothetical protein